MQNNFCYDIIIWSVQYRDAVTNKKDFYSIMRICMLQKKNGLRWIRNQSKEYVNLLEKFLGKPME